MKRSLYFDIDGTILGLSSGRPKSELASGQLELAIRESGFDDLICVGNFVEVVRIVSTVNSEYDGLGALYSLCQGTFQDEAWFRRVTRLVGDPKNRALELSLDSDWWYMDDLAHDYMSLAGLQAVFERERGRRVLVPSDEGDGADVIEWLRSARYPLQSTSEAAGDG